MKKNKTEIPKWQLPNTIKVICDMWECPAYRTCPKYVTRVITFPTCQKNIDKALYSLERERNLSKICQENE
jgi:hypothetical protein